MAIPWFVAFTAGMIGAFNPCGIALLPSYLMYLLSDRIETNQNPWYVGLRSGILITIGFVVVFGAAGFLVGLIGHLLFAAVPFISLLVAILLLIAAVFTWRGTLSIKWSFGTWTERLEQIFRRGSNGSFVVYGISYGLVSLTCSLPVFLAVVAEGLSTGTRGVILLFAAYTLGMGVVITLLSLLTMLTRTFVIRFIRSTIPIIQKLSALVMAAGGLYLVWYWVFGPGFQTVL
ncbi:cytochrome c biogenesis CcdA family protein [Alicyclobacillus sp. SO9]|uniref:cytochrome c biogenesis CcdA family protein n=1 Tax=Alicyclobacillus sp. SO9 TaxID=2665646 RepID=UPI0018E73668|nr:cytochrome c biogenesis protein CcdA [Alicyclobacillus sp. SO9]QQE78463.1 hypothetical protein GI364_21750 [Alicyclobacillus sp. SO9]